MKQKVLSCIMALVLVLGLLPGTALANELGSDTPPKNPNYVAWIEEQGFETLEAAVNAAPEGETTTITLGAGNYTLCKKNAATAKKI